MHLQTQVRSRSGRANGSVDVSDRNCSSHAYVFALLSLHFPGRNENVGRCCASSCRETLNRFFKWGKEGHGSRPPQLFLIVGLVLEAFATLWAFNQARLAGALDGDDVQCDVEGLLERFHASEVTQKTCQPLDPASNADALLLATLGHRRTYVPVPTFCEDVAEPTAKEDIFLELCSCREESLIGVKY